MRTLRRYMEHRGVPRQTSLDSAGSSDHHSWSRRHLDVTCDRDFHRAVGVVICQIRLR